MQFPIKPHNQTDSKDLIMFIKRKVKIKEAKEEIKKEIKGEKRQNKIKIHNSMQQLRCLLSMSAECKPQLRSKCILLHEACSMQRGCKDFKTQKLKKKKYLNKKTLGEKLMKRRPLVGFL